MSSIFFVSILEMRDLRFREGTGRPPGSLMHKGRARGVLESEPRLPPIGCRLFLNPFPQLENGLQGHGGGNDERGARSTEHGHHPQFSNCHPVLGSSIYPGLALRSSGKTILRILSEPGGVTKQKSGLFTTFLMSGVTLDQCPRLLGVKSKLSRSPFQSPDFP